MMYRMIFLNDVHVNVDNICFLKARTDTASEYSHRRLAAEDTSERLFAKLAHIGGTDSFFTPSQFHSLQYTGTEDFDENIFKDMDF